MARRSSFYALLPRSSIESEDIDSQTLSRELQYSSTWLAKRSSRILSRRIWGNFLGRTHGKRTRLLWLVAVPAFATLVLVLLTGAFNPSYTRRPRSYTGKNPLREKVFVAAAIGNLDLIEGAWGKAVIELIEAIGSENAFLSIYNNDSGPETKAALEGLSAQVPCENIIVSEHLPLEDFAQPELSTHDVRVRRISYLAGVRNRAMRPFYSSGRRFDKVLFLNDVVFSGQDAADLLFATGTSESVSHTSYHAACAIDFINPFKYYDTFATRDLNGYGIGLPFFPWFSDIAGGPSRRGVLDGSDAVHVRSCWGGMVAFEARWFEHGSDRRQDGDPVLDMSPVRFRGENELFWEASECCLIHADIEAQARRLNLSSAVGSNIVINPFIRVAYTESSFRWLLFTRRFERLYTLPHLWISWLVGVPSGNKPRQWQEEGDIVEDLVWVVDTAAQELPPDKLLDGTSLWDDPLQQRLYNGCYQKVEQTARPGGFCGSRKMLLLKPEKEPGERIWEYLPAPSLDRVCVPQA